MVDDLKNKGYTAEFVKIGGEDAPSAQTQTGVLYQVRVNGYTTKKLAEESMNAIRVLPDPLKAGYSGAYVSGSGSDFAVICGTFGKEASARKVAQDLISKGYSAAVRAV